MRRYLKILFLLLFVLFVAGCANFSPKTTWKLIHGYAKNDSVNAGIVSKDGNFIFAGYSNSKNPNGEDDVYVLKIDKWGNVLGELFPFGERDDNAQCIIETSDGGFLVVGESYSYATGISKDLYVMKYDSLGNLSWAKNFGGMDMDGGRWAIEDSEGNYVIVGWTRSFGAGNSDFYVLKLSPNGTVIWTKTWGGGNFDEANSIWEVSDGYLVVGFTLSYSAGGKDVALVKFDKNGNVLWYKTYGGSKDDVGSKIIETSDGNFLIIGSTLSYGTSGDIYVLKIDGNGNLLWQANYGGEKEDYANDVKETLDRGFIIVGATRSFSCLGLGIFLVKIDSKGELVWQKVYDGEGDDEANTVILMNDGGFLVGGYTRSWGAEQSDVIIMRLNSKGEL
ncbi:MAG: hypothetical protein ACPLVD_05355 [Dictyoglomus turgidum]|uniref:hypothetical protein n=1 Tax=Dictyoglomus turgidum TaxID=513050 RepID=UPI003C76F530